MFEDVVWRHRGKKIAPKTVMQKQYVDAIRARTVTFGIGPAGTGKTYLAMALAVAALHEREVARIILTRPAVEAGERLGFLPATCWRRSTPICARSSTRSTTCSSPTGAHAYMERGTIEVAPLAFMRGRTLNDSFIILDEAQNTSPEQMQMFLTRLGFGSKVVVTGDMTQIDLPREQASGLIQVQDMLERRSTGSRSSQFSAPGRRAAQARPAHRRGVQAPRGGDRHRAAALMIAVEVENRSGVDGRRGGRGRPRAPRARGGGVDDGELGIAFVGAGRDAAR